MFSKTFRFPENIARSLFLRWKMIWQTLRPKPESKRCLFIVGCQRSGTTMLSRIFEKDLNTKCYGEASKLSYMIPGQRLRFRRPIEIQDEIKKDRAAFIILKPLVESQNIVKLLHEFENGMALWIYRDFKDVASSNIDRFGQSNSMEDLRPIIDGRSDNWRSEKVSRESQALISKYYSQTMNANDAAVLFWIIRNRIYFELQLDARCDVLLVNYEALTRDPVTVMKQIYEFAHQEYPGDRIISGTNTNSISKGSDITLTLEIEIVATQLLDKLDTSLRSVVP